MNRKLKALGLALVAMCAFAAVSATGASAATTFTSESTHTTLSGSQIGTDKFVTQAGTVECSEATYSGTSTSTATSEQSISPTYSGCKAFGFVNATIDMNGCSYNFTIAATSSVHIVCPAGASIGVTAFNCEVTVPAQTVVGGITFHNSGTAGTTMDIVETTAISGITYIQHSKSFPGCATTGTNGVATSLYHNGTYNGEATLTGVNTLGAHVGITVS